MFAWPHEEQVLGAVVGFGVGKRGVGHFGEAAGAGVSGVRPDVGDHGVDEFLAIRRTESGGVLDAVAVPIRVGACGCLSA